MTTEWQDIASTLWARRRARSVLLEKMEDVRRRYNGDVVVALPNVDDEAALPPMTPALIADAIDHTAMRAASTMPMIRVPALDPFSEESMDRASTRREAYRATWRQSHLNLGLRRSYRHLAGYATCALAVVPDQHQKRPKIEVRDPLMCFPEPRAAEDVDLPRNAAFVYGKSVEWVKANYGDNEQAMNIIGNSMSARRGYAHDTTQLWDVCEWIDEDDVVMGLLGPRFSTDRMAAEDPFRWSCELARWQNKAGVCTVVIPERVTLDRIASQIANVVGIVDLMAKIMSLDIAATEKAIWPDRYIIGKTGQTPRVVGGRWKDGRTGETNIVLDAENVGELRSAPDPAGDRLVDRLERNARVSSGLVPQMGGETYGALRTGRGIDSLMGAAVDPRIQEMQEIMQTALASANEAVCATYKGYWPSRKYVLFTGRFGKDAHTELVPSRDMESHENAVSYPILGADVTQTTVEVGQLNGAKLISRQTARVLHPHIDDPEYEDERVLFEDLEDSLKQSILARAADPAGGFPPEDMAYLLDTVQRGTSLAKAVMEVNRRAQERQAQLAAEAPEGMATDPLAQPGVGNPGEGGQVQLAPGAGAGYGPQGEGTPIPPPAQGLQNLGLILKSLKGAGSGGPPAPVMQQA